ncbi:type III pantothenate kinase [Bdellovibrionota bacterium]
MNCLAVDIGNSQISVGWFAEEKLTKRDNRPSHTESIGEVRGWIDEAIQSGMFVVFGSVVPTLCESLTNGLDASSFHVLEFKDLPLKYNLDKPQSVGIDRLINSAAAFKKTKGSVIVVGLGTATIIDLVDNDGVYQGGLIFPGIQTMLNSLSRDAAQLPSLTFSPQEGKIGCSTEEAMLVGVQAATEGAVRSAIADFQEITPNPEVIFTGGWSKIFADKSQIDGLVLPDLTLDGIANFGTKVF